MLKSFLAATALALCWSSAAFADDLAYGGQSGEPRLFGAAIGAHHLLV